MNPWLQRSIIYANQRDYLDELFRVYPMSCNPEREISEERWNEIESSFDNRDNEALLAALLKVQPFPLKDSYVAFLKRCPAAIQRNPRTVRRICGRLYEMGLDSIYKQCSAPKETNRQIGPLFKHWCRSGALGVNAVPLAQFISSEDDAVLDDTDEGMMRWARENLNYTRDKGLDFVGRFKGQYVIGEAKFLSDFGGHQDAQFDDALSTLATPNVNAKIIAILDGVVWLKSNNKMHRILTTVLRRKNIMSALVLRDFLYSL